MSALHRSLPWVLVLSTALLIALGSFVVRGVAQEAELDAATTAEAEAAAAEDPFAVPEGTPEELIAFIEGVANPTQQFTSSDEVRQYQASAATAINTAADQILAAPASDEQLADAVQWKVAALGIKSRLGDRGAEQQIEKFLERLAKDERPAVVGSLAQTRLLRNLERWNRLGTDDRQSALDQYVADVKAAGLSRQHVGVLQRLDDMLGDTDDSAMAGRAIKKLLPLFRESDDPRIVRLAEPFEAIARRLALPGNRMELEGTLLDGTPLDWDAYRGKVVLVDYWATWCGPCRAEIPNIVENYQAYRDQGFEVLGISLDEDRGRAEQFMQEAGVDWPTLFSDDPHATGWEHPMAAKYAITGIPRAILVDQEGVVVSMTARGPQLRAELEKLLGQPGGNASPASGD